MKRVFEKNLEKLAQRYPDLAERVRTCDPSPYEITASAIAGQYNLTYRGASSSVFFYDPNDPFAHVRLVLEGFHLEKAKIIFLFGLGLGYQLWVLYQVLTADGPLEDIIVVEKDVACLKLALETIDISDILEDTRVHLVIGSEVNNLFKSMEKITREITVPKLKAAKFVIWPVSLKLSPEYYESAKKALVDAGNRWITDRGNDAYDTLVAYEHFFKNCGEYLNNPGVSSIKGLFSKRPAVVVATGPSLSRNVGLLNSVKERAVVLSADASLRILYNHGIAPHFVAVSERTPGIDKFFLNVPNLEETVLATVSFAHPTTIRAYHGPKLFMHRGYGFFEVLGLKDDCLSLGSHTASVCFQLATFMGCDPIILIGQDLAFGPTGSTHADGCVFGETQKYLDAGDQYLEVEGNLGGTVRTNPLWYSFMKEYEKLIGLYNGTVINATEGGAKLNGTKIVPLKEALDTFCHEDFHPRSQVMKMTAHSRPLGSKDMMTKGVNLILAGIEECIELSRQGVSLAKCALESISKVQSETIPSGLAEEIGSTVKRVYGLIDSIYYSEVTQRLNEYFMGEIMPFFAEWLVIDERFEDVNWARAYRLKLAKEFFLTTGQLCISLRRLLCDGRDILNNL